MPGLTSGLQPPAAATPPAPMPGGAMPSPQQPTPASQQGQGQAQAPKGPPITDGPVDQELLKKFIANCMNVVTGTLAQIVKMVTQSDDKVAALAQATVTAVVRVEDSLEQSGQQLNLGMTFEAGAETITDIADALSKAGVHDYDQKELEAGFLRAVDQYRLIRQQQGRLDPAMFQQIIAKMKQAQANGTLDQEYPGLTEFAQKTAQDNRAPYKPDSGADDGDGDEPTAPGTAPAAPAGKPSPAQAPPKAKKGRADDFPPAMLKKEKAGAKKPKAKPMKGATKKDRM